jgi:two-component system chemotaxis sensor kinase CheA
VNRQDLIIDFVSEARDHLDSAESCLLEMEEVKRGNQNSVTSDSINLLFRNFHTLKGSAGLLRLQSVVTVTHEAETILDMIRNQPNTNIILNYIDVLLTALDFLRELFEIIEQTLSDQTKQTEAEKLKSVLIQRRDQLKSELSGSGIGNESFSNSRPSVTLGSGPEKGSPSEGKTGYGLFDEDPPSSSPTEAKFGIFEDQPGNPSQEPKIETPGSANTGYGLFDESETDSSHSTSNQNNQTKTNSSDNSRAANSRETSEIGITNQPPNPGINSGESGGFEEAAQEKNGDPTGVNTNSRKKDIKISTDKLDLLLDLVGELVIAESNVSYHPEIADLKLEGFRSATRHLNKIVRDLQEVALSTRMIPIAGIFNRMNRLIRDLEIKTNKPIQLQISGEDTEIDKSVVDLISDPIIHILRNAMDHGIETADIRRERGKNEKGLIQLHARQSANEVWVIIRDDGGGLVRSKLIHRAQEKGLIRDNGTALSDKEVFELIFHPGFSTAASVSDISGRGVGMDIVKKNIEKLGGRIDIQSQEGVGTKFTLRIPLSLGIMEGTVIQTGDNFFTIQTIEIRELISLDEKHSVEIYKGQRVVEIRGKHIPMLSINDILELKTPIQYEESSSKILVVIEYDGEVLGLVADTIMGNQSIVIKSLNENLAGAKGVNGFTILGNGRVSLILDTRMIFEKFRSIKNLNEAVSV